MNRLLSVILAVATVLAGILAGVGAPATAGPGSSRATTTAWDSGDTEVVYDFTALTGGFNGAQSVTLPSIGVVKGADFEVDIDRELALGLRTYSDAKKKARFTESGAQWDVKEMDASPGGLTLRKYAGNFIERFQDFGGIDNASMIATGAPANPLMEDGGFGSEVVSGRDTVNTIPKPFDTGAKASQSVTYFYDGRSFRSGVINLRANCGSSGITVSAEVKAFDPTAAGGSGSWVSLYKNANLAWNFNGALTPLNPASPWATGRFTQFQLKADCSWTWASPTLRFDGTFTVERFLPTSYCISAPIDLVASYGWQPTWVAYNVTAVPWELVPPPANTNIAYEVSATNGTHWEPVTKNATFRFGQVNPQNIGNILRWKAIFTTANTDTTGRLTEHMELQFNRKFSSSQVYTSISLQQNWPITKITTWLNATAPPNTATQLEVTREPGVNWTTMTNGQTIDLPFLAADDVDKRTLQFRITLTSDGLNRPTFRNASFEWQSSMYPSDIVVDFGADDRITFARPGIFFPADGPIALTGADADEFVIELNNLLPHSGEITDTTKIAMTVSSTTAGIVKVRSLSIVYGLPPVLSQNIPDITMKEDSSVTDVINLEDSFSDDFDDGKMSFVIAFEEEPSRVDATLTNGRLSFTAPSPNWTGSRRFLIRASDSEGLQTPSNTFTVTVTNENDPPRLGRIGAQVAYVEEAWQYTVDVSDGDVGDTHTFEMTSSPLTTKIFLDRNTGTISMVPEKADILTDGTNNAYQVVVTVTDANGLKDSTSFPLEVRNQNVAPTLSPVPTLFVEVGKTRTFQLQYDDIDLAYGDSLTWYVLKDPAKAKTLAMDQKGQISWAPTTEDLITSPIDVTVTVRDSAGAEASQSFQIMVTRQNQPPSEVVIVRPTTTGTYNDSASIEFLGTAKDPDPQDVLSFRWYLDSSTKEFGVGSNFRSVVPAGRHTLTLTVDDGNTHSVSQTSEFTVASVKKDDKITVTPMPGERARLMGMDPWQLYMVATLGAMIVVGALSSLWARRNKSTLARLEAERGESSKEPDLLAEPPQAPSQPPMMGGPPQQ